MTTERKGRIIEIRPFRWAAWVDGKLIDCEYSSEEYALKDTLKRIDESIETGWPLEIEIELI
jgi:hypothetical protein